MTASEPAVAAGYRTERILSHRARIGRVHGKLTLGLSLLVFLLFISVGVLGPLIAPHDPRDQSLTTRLRPPAWQANGSNGHLLGTDNLGRDELSRLIYGTRVSLIVVVTAIPLSMLCGTGIGVVAGWRRGTVDRIAMRLVDIQLALPVVLFALLLVAVFKPSLRNVVIILSVWGWASYARVVRGEVLSVRERDFVMAARALGASDHRIVVRHVLPNLINIIVVLATLDIAAVILAEAALSFLGVGVPLSTPSWGGMVSEGRNYIRIAWWLITIPGLAILIVSLAGNLFGDWLRDALEPRLRNTR